MNSFDLGTPILQADNISKRFDYMLFENLSIGLHLGQSIAIVGESGCGKSTLLNILSTLLLPDSGTVTYNNQNLYDNNAQNTAAIRRDSFGIIFQAHYLFRGFTSLENLTIGSLLSGHEIDHELLKALNIDHILDQNIGQLSGGQQQRLSVARVLTKKPTIIFADEPTGNLDKGTAIDVSNLLFDYVATNDAAMVLVTHDRTLASMCDIVYELDNYILKEL